MKNVGSIAQSRGKEAEIEIGQQLDVSGWTTTTSPELDYARKTDLQVECPEGIEWNIQVSTSPKSNRQRETLEKRGVTPIASTELERSGLSAGIYICNRVCSVVECPQKNS